MTFTWLKIHLLKYNILLICIESCIVSWGDKGRCLFLWILPEIIAQISLNSILCNFLSQILLILNIIFNAFFLTKTNFIPYPARLNKTQCLHCKILIIILLILWAYNYLIKIDLNIFFLKYVTTLKLFLT